MSRKTGVKNKIKKCYNNKCEDYRSKNKNRCKWPDEVYYCMNYVSRSQYYGHWEEQKRKKVAML